MKYTSDIQPAVHTDIRKSARFSRVRQIVAGSGVAGALLLGGLFSMQAVHPAGQVQNQFPVVRASAVVSSEPVKAIPLSYHIAQDYVGMARQAALNAGINPDLFVRQIQQESGFNPGAGSPAGAQGIAQFMPGTAASMGVNPYDPSSALSGAARMMAGLSAQFGGDYAKALAAYNAGAGAVQSAVARAGGNWLACMPAETQNYVAIIMG